MVELSTYINTQLLFHYSQFIIWINCNKNCEKNYKPIILFILVVLHSRPHKLPTLSFREVINYNKENDGDVVGEVQEQHESQAMPLSKSIYK